MDTNAAEALTRLIAIDTTQRVIRADVADLAATQRWLTEHNRATATANCRKNRRLDRAVRVIDGCVKAPGVASYAAVAGADLAIYLRVLQRVSEATRPMTFAEAVA